MKEGEPFLGWKITKKLGEGAFGKVFLAEKGNGKSAIKIITIPTDRDLIELKRFYKNNDEKLKNYIETTVNMFEKECEILQELNSTTGIVSYQDSYKQQLSEYQWEIVIRMEYLTPLNDYIEKNGIKVGQVLHMIYDLSKALLECQLRNIIHRDIKEANIFVNQSEDFKIGDFGVAKNMEDLSRAYTQAGTYSYMAPEVASGKGYDYRADMYSLGIVMYTLLNNLKLPYKAPKENIEQLIYDKLTGEKFDPPMFSNSSIYNFLTKLCAIKPEDRFTSFKEVNKEISMILTNSDDAFKNQNCINNSVIQYDKSKFKQNSGNNYKKLDLEEETKQFEIIKNTEKSTHKRSIIDQYLKPAMLGNKDAQFNLGVVYFNGSNEIEKDFKKSINWFEKASEQSHTQSQCYLGYMYENGIGVEKDSKKAFELYEKAANLGDPVGQFNLGTMYEFDEYVVSDLKKAFEWYIKSANQGYPNAQYNLAIMYMQGKYVDIDYSKAADWYFKSAMQGYPSAQYNLAIMYCEGKGVEKNYEYAIEWHTKAANQGYFKAQNYLGVLYEKGLGTKKDINIAYEWYLKAALAGYSRAQFNLGLLYENGDIKGGKNYNKAYEWYLKSANSGYSRAQYNLGVLYENGKGVTKDYTEALKWYLQSAKQGFATAQYNVGVFYENGLGVNKDYSIAYSWYLKSANQDYVSAQYNLGVMLMNGNGVEVNYKEAIYWYEKAENKNYSNAQCNLGYMYQKGLGVEKDLNKAIYYYKKSAEQGNTYAIKNIERLQNKTT